MNLQIKKSILSSFVCDTYSLGMHWVYDEDDLQKSDFNWEILNAPESLWHKGKACGDFTHYGDQTLFLLEFIVKHGSFDRSKYYVFWKEKMSNYEGYVDASSRAALETTGAVSNDLSICGRIAPLLICSSSKEEFLCNVAAFVSITHNSEISLNASLFFAEFLWLSQKNDDMFSIINTIKPNYPMFTKWIDEAIGKKDANSFKTIREFGPACGVDGGFAGVIYLLLQNKSFKKIMIQNAKAGGDSSSRGMIVAMILGMKEDVSIPREWLDGINSIDTLNSFFDL